MLRPLFIAAALLAAPAVAAAQPPRPVVVAHTPRGTVLVQPNGDGRSDCSSGTCRTGRYAAAQRSLGRPAGVVTPPPMVVVPTRHHGHYRRHHRHHH